MQGVTIGHLNSLRDWYNMMETKESTKEERNKGALEIGSGWRFRGWRNDGLVRYPLSS